MWIYSGNLLNSKSVQLNAFRDKMCLDRLFKHIVDLHPSQDNKIHSIEICHKKLPRNDLDISVFFTFDGNLSSLYAALEESLSTLQIDTIDTVILAMPGLLYNKEQRHSLMEAYEFLLQSSSCKTVAVLEWSIDQIKALPQPPHSIYIRKENCCDPPTELLEYCNPLSIDIMPFDHFAIKDIRSIGFDTVLSFSKYIINIKSRSICTHQGYILHCQ